MATDLIAAAIVANALTEVFVIIIAFIALFALIKIFVYGPRSQQHRKLLTNLYVAGKIRQIASKDGINLKEEQKELLRTIKEQRKYSKDLDDTIELELQEKIIKEADLEKK